ncbi:MAG: CvpA family protein [Clostridia bacterium]
MIFDIIILILIIMFAIKYYNEGLINAVVLFFSKIISFVVAFAFAKRCAGDISQKYVEEKLYGYADSIIAKNYNFYDIYNSLKSNVTTENSKTIEFLLGMGEDELQTVLQSNADEAVAVMRESIVTSVSYGLTYIAIFLSVLILVMVATSIVLSVVDFVFNITLLGYVNRLGGLALGVITALFVSTLVIWTIMIVMPVTTMEDGIFNSQVIENTYIIRHICNSLPESLMTLIY